MFKKKTLKNKKMFFLLIIYTLSHIFLYTNNFYIYFLNPLLWLTFLIIFYRQDLNLLNKKEANITITISLVFLTLYLASGFIFGFNKNPYNPTLIYTFQSLWKVILPICGIEIVRYCLIKSNKNHFGIMTSITIIIIIYEINFKVLFLSHHIIFFHYVLSILIPIIAQNILFTYLSLNSHYNVPIIIRIFNEVPKFFLPVIPYSNWFIEGSFAIIKVLIIYYLYKYFIFNKKNTHYFTNKTILYPFTIIASILFVLFMLGLFNYQPIAILSNSMNPIFRRGDVVIYKRKETILPGDIIVFKYEDQFIVHRVVSINEYYITKGDANNTVDYIKIKKEDIKGVYQFHIKYLGYPSIWLNEFFTKEN